MYIYKKKKEKIQLLNIAVFLTTWKKEHFVQRFLSGHLSLIHTNNFLFFFLFYFCVVPLSSSIFIKSTLSTARRECVNDGQEVHLDVS